MTPDNIIEQIKKITETKIANSKDLIKQGCLGEIKLYTVTKKDLTLRYDLIETQICPYTAEETVLSYENDKLIKYERGQIILLPIPPYCPELNPAEKMWQWMKDKMAMKIYDNLETLENKIENLIEKAENQIIKSPGVMN